MDKKKFERKEGQPKQNWSQTQKQMKEGNQDLTKESQ